MDDQRNLSYPVFCFTGHGIHAVTRVSGACRLAGGEAREIAIGLSWQKGDEMPVPVWRFWPNILGGRLSYFCFIIEGAMSQGLQGLALARPALTPLGSVSLMNALAYQ